MAVWSSSWGRVCLFASSCSTFRIDRICLSECPPMWLACGGWKIHSISSLASLSLTNNSLFIFNSSTLISLHAPSRFEPLLDLIVFRRPLRLMNLLIAIRRDGVSNLLAISRYTAPSVVTREYYTVPLLFLPSHCYVQWSEIVDAYILKCSRRWHSALW